MKPELPSTEPPYPEASLPATEIEYALILSQMIEVAEQDPSQLRLAIYEFARAKLIYNTMNAGVAEKERLSDSLEAAIAGVERFSRRRKGNKRMVFSHGGTELADRLEETPSRPMLENPLAAPVSDEESAKKSRQADALLAYVRSARFWGERQNWFAIVMSLFVILAALTFFTQRTLLWRDEKKMAASSAEAARKDVSARAPDATRDGGGASVSLAPAPAPVPLPKDYGVYVVNGSTLIELQPLAEQVPDKRIEMSTPVSQVGQATIPDGAAKFVVYKRDFASDAPDRVEVRTLSRVTRVISFDAKGKPVFSPATSSWIIRNVAYEFKVRPIAGHPEMLLVQPKDDDRVLPAGRYVIALKDRGYDFNVAGDVVDPAQCVERTDARNGSFYSDCQ